MRPGRLIGVVVLAGCHRAEPVADDVAAPRVEVQAIRQDSISEVLILTGRLTPMPGGSVTLMAPADAVVQAIAVQIGEAVAPGHLLMELDAPELSTAARSLTAQAHSDSLDLERQRELFDQGITSRRQLEDREASAAASRAQAQAAQQLLQRARLVSPIAGGVQRLTVQVGERVAAGQPLVEIVNGSGVDFHAAVSAATLVRLHRGQGVALSADGLEEMVRGSVVGIAPAVDSISGMGEVVVRAPAAHGLRAGGGATGSLQLRSLRQALIVPDSALVPAERGLQLFVVGTDSLVHAREVALVLRSGGRAAVSGEVAAGELVVVRGAYGLSDRSRVRPVSAP